MLFHESFQVYDFHTFHFIYVERITFNSKTYKMGDLKPISHKQFNEFIKGKGFKGRNDYKLKELKVNLVLRLCAIEER